MFIDWKGKIEDKFYVLGHPAVPLYLLDGKRPVLFDAGFTGLSKIYKREISQALGSRSPYLLLLTHSHWDHVGSVSYLKGSWPEMKIGGSSQAGEIVKRAKVIEQIRALNKEAIHDLRKWGVNEVFEGQFESFDLDIILKDKNIILLESCLSIQVIYTPGHTWDFLSYWVPEKGILVASEAVTCDGISEFLVDYHAYLNSLKRLSLLDVRTLCTGHGLVITGVEAKQYIVDSIENTKIYVSMVEQFLREEKGNIDRVVARIKEIEWENKGLPKQPEKAYIMNTELRVTLILERMKDTV